MASGISCKRHASRRNHSCVKKCLRGLEPALVSDNGRKIVSDLFQNFSKENGILHKRSAPFHPATNGQVERYVQMMKKGLGKLEPGKDIASGLNALLATYCILPHAFTRRSLVELLFTKNVEVRLMLCAQIPEAKKLNVNADETRRMLYVGERVVARDYVAKSKWLPGQVTQCKGYLHYIIKLDDGRVWHRQNRKREAM